MIRPTHSRRGQDKKSQQRASNLAQHILRTAHRDAERTALIVDSSHYSYGCLAQRICAFADHLVQQHDWLAGERVAVRLPNGMDYLAAFYGTLLADGVCVPLPQEQRTDWIQQICQRTNCRWIVDESSPQTVIPTGAKRSRVGTPRLPQGLAVIFFTSGSTGDPKGVMLSHANLIANARSIVSSLPFLPTDRALATLPFCHAYGNSVLQSHLISGATLVVAGSTAFPESLVDAMRSHGVTSFAGVPDLHRLLMRGSTLSGESLPSLRYATVAGGALQPELIEQFAARLSPAEFLVMYGQTEATARLSCLPFSELWSHLGSIGRGIREVELQVVDADGRPVTSGEQGEIRARGPNVMLGYWDDPVATRQCLREGWLYTGDLATVDDEGYIYPQGRSSQLMKIAGYRLHPAEIESVLSRAMGNCDPVVVPYEDAEGATRIALYLLPTSDTPLPVVREVRRICQSCLPRHLRPHFIEILESPPLTPSMKVDRQFLSRLATELAVDSAEEIGEECRVS